MNTFRLFVFADNESVDTFSFALVLLSLAAGDINYVRLRCRFVSSSSYAQGFRPGIPAAIRERCPDLASLIVEMWDGDFRKRPALREVVVQLEAASTAALDKILASTEADASAEVEGAHAAQILSETQYGEEDESGGTATIARLTAQVEALRARNAAQKVKLDAFERT